jgi:hypothetical protein
MQMTWRGTDLYWGRRKVGSIVPDGVRRTRIAPSVSTIGEALSQQIGELFGSAQGNDP